MTKKLKDNILLILLAVSLGLLAALAAAETTEEVSIEEGKAVGDARIENIQLEQGASGDIQVAAGSTQQAKSAGKGKSLLRVTKMGAASAAPPKTSSEAAKLGWKAKAINAQQPVSSHIKEVPREIAAKKARQDAKKLQVKK